MTTIVGGDRSIKPKSIRYFGPVSCPNLYFDASITFNMDWEEDAPVRYARSKTEKIKRLFITLLHATHHPIFYNDRDI